MKYVYLRLFLSEVEQPPLLLTAGSISIRQSRQDFLSSVLSDRVRFSHRKVQMDFVPIKKETSEEATYIFGRIGRQRKTLENSAPEEKFASTEHVGWRAANIIIDTSHHRDGQKIAMQFRPDVGSPLAIVNSLVQQINAENADSGWLVTVNAITESQTFWKAVEQNKGQITRAEFTYITPNVLGLSSVLNEKLREYKRRENAQQVIVTLIEPNGNLQLDTPEVHDAVEYISEGGGTTKLKAGKDVIFDSSDASKARAFETDDKIELANADSRQSLVQKVFK